MRGLSFKQRKQLGRLHRKIEKAEQRVNIAIVKRIKEIREDPELIKVIDEQVEKDAQHIQREGIQGYKRDILLASLSKKESVV